MEWLIFLAVLAIFILYLVVDFIKKEANANQFMDQWMKKLVWLWLPFYTFYALIKEVMKKK